MNVNAALYRDARREWRVLETDERRLAARARMFAISEENAKARRLSRAMRKPLKLVHSRGA